MLTPEIIDEYRPYCDEEINAAMHRIADSVHFPSLAAYVWPGRDPEEVKKQICAYTTVDEFQREVMKTACERIIAQSATAFSQAGIRRTDPAKRYVFISNHRDIVLDAMLLQYALHQEERPTAEITFGTNLMHTQEAVEIGKSNKMFKIIRGGKPRELFLNSLHVSGYIRYAVTEKRQSVWIAQRNGRTKNGWDKTEIAVLKMLAMSSKANFTENFEELHVTPVAMSYEYEPCDFLKTQEIYLSRRYPYRKAPGEDLNSILHGISQFKGYIHGCCCETVTPDELATCSGLPPSERFKALAEIIDQKIYAGYACWKTNYMAHDLMYGKSEFSGLYHADDREAFTDYMREGLSRLHGDPGELQAIFLGIYAHSVSNRNRPPLYGTYANTP